jgi:hypothetical protein
MNHSMSGSEYSGVSQRGGKERKKKFVEVIQPRIDYKKYKVDEMIDMHIDANTLY